MSERETEKYKLGPCTIETQVAPMYAGMDSRYAVYIKLKVLKPDTVTADYAAAISKVLLDNIKKIPGNITLGTKEERAQNRVRPGEGMLVAQSYKDEDKQEFASKIAKNIDWIMGEIEEKMLRRKRSDDNPPNVDMIKKQMHGIMDEYNATHSRIEKLKNAAYLRLANELPDIVPALSPDQVILVADCVQKVLDRVTKRYFVEDIDRTIVRDWAGRSSEKNNERLFQMEIGEAVRGAIVRDIRDIPSQDIQEIVTNSTQIIAEEMHPLFVAAYRSR